MDVYTVDKKLFAGPMACAMTRRLLQPLLAEGADDKPTDVASHRLRQRPAHLRTGAGVSALACQRVGFGLRTGRQGMSPAECPQPRAARHPRGPTRPALPRQQLRPGDRRQRVAPPAPVAHRDRAGASGTAQRRHPAPHRPENAKAAYAFRPQHRLTVPATLRRRNPR